MNLSAAQRKRCEERFAAWCVVQQDKDIVEVTGLMPDPLCLIPHDSSSPSSVETSQPTGPAEAAQHATDLTFVDLYKEAKELLRDGIGLY